jgi:FkbM family methyltransferase
MEFNLNYSPITYLLKKIIKAILFSPSYIFAICEKLYVKLIGIFWHSFDNFYYDSKQNYVKAKMLTIKHLSPKKIVELKIYTPNYLCRYRAKTFSSKEPETLSWIDEFGGNGAFYDIGANIGLYSLYYASTKSGNVYSFEPSVFNLELLAKNIYLNGFNNQIKIIANPLSNNNSFANFSFSSIEEGSALAAFGVNFDQNGSRNKPIFCYQTLGLSLDNLIRWKLIIEKPQIMKIDVDGIEHLILSGAIKILRDNNLKSILVEINEAFPFQKNKIEKILYSSGFILRTNKFNSKKSTEMSYIHNQIWVRKKILKNIKSTKKNKKVPNSKK